MASKQTHVEDVILFHGPPVCGKTSYYWKYLSESHVRISAEDYFCRNPDFGLRDVVREVIQLLKQEKKVVVDDSNSSRKTRKSYIQLIKSKWNKAKICILCILPKYGLHQLQWSRLYREASHDYIETENDNEHKVYNAVAMETKIKAWFCDDNPNILTYSHPEVDQPTKSEEVEIQKHETNLQAHSPHKFEVPVLGLQWEGLLKDSCDDVVLNCGVAKVCKIWQKNNPCGRMIIICDGKQNYSGINATKETIERLMILLMRGLDGCPVYVFHVDDLGSSGCYASPPDPGILAYLQQRHLLDLHHKRSLYLFHTNAHMKMAEAAGMQHVKMGRVLQHPNLIDSGHAALRPNTPDFLQHVEVCQNQRSDSILDQLPTIPLYHDMADFSGNRIAKTLRYGRVEYLFANDVDVINRYQSLYTENAAKVGETGSCIAAMTGIISGEIEKTAIELRVQSSVTIASTFSDRDLPKWMLGKSDSRQSIASLERTESSDSTSDQGRTKVKQTVYVMTEQELVETAKQVLLQAGREDILNRVLEADIENSVKKRKKIAMTCESTLMPDPKLAIKAEHDKTTSANEERQRKGDHPAGDLTHQLPEQVENTEVAEPVEKTEAAEILDSLFGGETQRKKSPRTRRVKESHLEEGLYMSRLSGTRVMETITTIPATTALEQLDHGKESDTEPPMTDPNSLFYSEHKSHKRKAATSILDDLFS